MKYGRPFHQRDEVERLKAVFTDVGITYLIVGGGTQFVVDSDVAQALLDYNDSEGLREVGLATYLKMIFPDRR